MKKWHSLRLGGVLSLLALSLSGCHSGPQQPEITKANFGRPGQPLPAGWGAMMQKVRTSQAHQGPPPSAKQ